MAFLRCPRRLGRDIFLVRIAGGEPKRLTFDNVIICGLDWTPDGAYIVFSSDRLGGRAACGKFEPPAANRSRCLWATALLLPLTFPRWAPSGVHPGDMNTNIWRYEVPRTTGRSAPPTKLIASTGENFDPQFSPDGKRIVFVSTRSGSREIWVCDSDGSNPRQLTFFGGPHVAGRAGLPMVGRLFSTPLLKVVTAPLLVSEEGGQPRRL